MMIPPTLTAYIDECLGIKTLAFHPITGGDINEVYRITTIDHDSFFIKMNDAQLYPMMLEKETFNLEYLSSTNTIRIPEIIHQGNHGNHSFLILEWINGNTRMDGQFYKQFGQRLALLHSKTQDHFGWSDDNYIGTLVQYNTNRKSAVDFFIHNRINPQAELMEQGGHMDFHVKKLLDELNIRLSELIPDERPSLIHGDLWSGNWMCSATNEPVLIDPATSYGIREMDLAMMELFGHPPQEFFDAYQEVYPLEKGWKDRLGLYQLYYLMVHVNLFGRSYLSSVQQILRKFTR